MSTHLQQRSLRKLYIAQFLSAFVDNAFFYIILGFLEDSGVQNPANSMVVPQTLFIVAYIVLAPFVGTFAEKWAKSRVLLIGNVIKAVGIALMFTGISPALCYMVVGIGAVLYSPAKYGILMELTTTSKQLLVANGRIEGFTITAIIMGTVAGGFMALFPGVWIELALCLVLYGLSLVMALSIPKGSTDQTLRYLSSSLRFFKDIRTLMRNPIARFTLIGTAGFWMIAVLLRLSFIEWLAVNLPTLAESQRPFVFGVTTVGIIIGALLAPRLYEIKTFYKCTIMGVWLVVIVAASAYAPNLPFLIPLLLAIGAFGGLYIVPMNAALQETGSPLVGAGKVVAIQNVFENAFMLLAMGFLFTKSSGMVAISIENVIVVGAFALLLIVLYAYSQLAKVKRALAQQHAGAGR
jgi:LPLT family lysophospholipid transporter-like MFS transporter